MPTREDVRKAFQLITNRAKYEYFFSRLGSADWIEPLLAEGRFQNPPAPVRDGEYLRFPTWPESRYLARVARQAPETAARAVRSIPVSDNITVHEDLADAALEIPIDDVVHWSRGEIAWLSSQTWLPHRLPDKLMAVAEKLAVAGRVEVSLDLTRALFAPLPDPRSNESADRSALPPQPVARFDAYDFAEALKRALRIVTTHAGVRGLEVLADLLVRAIELSLEKPAPPTDFSFIWIDAIEHTGDGDRDIREPLASAVRDAAVELAKRGKCAEVLDVLDGKGWDLFRRLSLHVLRVSCSTDRARIREHLLTREAFEYPPTRHEYALLLRDAFGGLDPVEQEQVLEWIDAGPDRDAMRERHVMFSGQPLSAELEQSWVEQWQRDRLSPLRDALSPERRRHFDSLIDRHGEPKFDYGVTVSSGVRWGEISPVSAEELQRMPGDQLRQYLRDWKPPEGVDAPTRGGVVQNLRTLGDEFFLRESSNASSWIDLHPAYTTAFLSELERIVRNGKRIDWPAVLLLSAPIAESPASDQESRWLMQQVIDLLKSGFDADDAGPDPKLRFEIWQVLDSVLRLTDLAGGDSQLEGDFVDFLTLAINSFRGRLTEAVIRYAIWVKRHEAPSDQSWRIGERIPDVARVLDRLVSPTKEPSPRVRAIFGAQLGPLMWLDAYWVQQKLPDLFPEGAGTRGKWAAVWDTFLLYGMPFGQALDVFHDQYARAIRRMAGQREPNDQRKRVDERLAEHLMTYTWQGRLAYEEGSLLPEFFQNANEEIRKRALDFVGRSLKNSGEVPDEIIARLMGLLDWRLSVVARERRLGAELTPYGWWFVSEKFPDDWALGRLVSVLRLTGSVQPDHLVAERLVRYVDGFPKEVAEATRCMVEGIREAYEVASWRVEAWSILSALRQTSDPNVRREVARAIDALVQRRFTEFRELSPM